MKKEPFQVASFEAETLFLMHFFFFFTLLRTGSLSVGGRAVTSVASGYGLSLPAVKVKRCYCLLADPELGCLKIYVTTYKSGRNLRSCRS